MAAMPEQEIRALATELRMQLEQQHGLLLGGATLVCALGYASTAAMRQARRRGTLPIPLFTVPGRRGYFALSRDVADWL